jgi:hypothetical protein
LYLCLSQVVAEQAMRRNDVQAIDYNLKVGINA